MNDLQTFTNAAFGKIRILYEDGKPLFCGADACKALGYSNQWDALKRHCRYLVKREVPNPQSVSKKVSMNFLPEGDLYRLITHSKMPSAEKFERWVFDEVLPTLRQTGQYGADPEELERLRRSNAVLRDWLDLLAARKRDLVDIQGTLADVRKDRDEANGSLPAFDYSGLDDQTVQDLHLAEREVAGGKRMAEIGLRRMADGVAIAHDALCGACDNLSQAHNNQHSEKTFGRWCESVGLNRKAAERLLQVSKLFDSSSPRQQQVLEELSPSLLYAAAKPSAPPELVDAVKSGDITSHKQYQDLLTRYNAEHAAREQAEQERDEAATHIQAARDMQIDTARERDAALRRAEQAEAERNAARQEASAASVRAAKAEKAREEAEHIAEISRKRADRWQATAEAAQNQPVAAVVDEDEVNRRAHKLADELTAPLREELESARAAVADPDQAELDARNAYDSIILASRTISNAWQSVKQQLAKIPPNQRSGAIDTFNKVLASIQSEAISCL